MERKPDIKDLLQHAGVKGMKWDPNKKKHSAEVAALMKQYGLTKEEATSLQNVINEKHLKPDQIKEIVNVVHGLRAMAKQQNVPQHKDTLTSKIKNAIDNAGKDLPHAISDVKKSAKSAYKKIKRDVKAKTAGSASKSKPKRTLGNKLNDLGKTVLGVTYPSTNINGVEVNPKTLKPLKKKDYPEVRAKRDRKAATKRTLKDLGFSDKTIKKLTKEVKPKITSTTIIEAPPKSSGSKKKPKKK
jgi:hypothetical protein